MPLLKSKYKAPFWYRNGHLSTIMPSLFRKVGDVDYQRERITTPDKDFLDIDWLKNGYKRLVICTHGLEGDSDRHYVKGMAKSAAIDGWDVAAWNCRSCSGEMNKLPRLYHHGDSEDLETVVEHCKRDYDEIVLIGWSMGASITLKYLAEQSERIPVEIKAATAISAPLNLGDSARELEKPINKFYLKRFMGKLKTRMRRKSKQYPDIINVDCIDKILLFSEFDNTYTAPLHGFESAEDFYIKSSTCNIISKIRVPTLILNALDDPFLPESCYPYAEAERHPFIFLETPKRGGHTGFVKDTLANSWSDGRALAFFADNTE